MAAAHTRSPCRAGRTVPVQLGLFDAPTGRAGEAGQPRSRTAGAVSRRYRRPDLHGRACIPVPCVGCGRLHGRDTRRTCLCAACEAWQAAKAAERMLPGDAWRAAGFDPDKDPGLHGILGFTARMVARAASAQGAQTEGLPADGVPA